jgi:hypothetical protein
MKEEEKCTNSTHIALDVSYKRDDLKRKGSRKRGNAKKTKQCFTYRRTFESATI